MQYRRLGRSGLQVSELSLGSWVTYHNQVDTGSAVEMLTAARDAGINFFDNAEAYALGKSEEIMGQALRQLGWGRHTYVVSTKFYWGIDKSGTTVNYKDTLNRKYLMQAIDGSLKRFGLDEIDLVYCLNRARRQTPHRFAEVGAALDELVERVVGLLTDPGYLASSQLDDVHQTFGAVCTLAELQRAVPGAILTPRPLRLVLDRRPFI